MTYLTKSRTAYLVKHAAEMLRGVQQVQTGQSTQNQQDVHEQTLAFEEEKQQLELEKMRMELFMEQKKQEMALRHSEQEFALKQQIAQQDAENKGLLNQMKIDAQAQKAQADGSAMESPPQLGANPIDYTINMAGGGSEVKEGEDVAYPQYEFNPEHARSKYPSITRSAVTPTALGALLGFGAGHLFPSEMTKKLTTQAATDGLDVALKRKLIAQSLGANWKSYALGTGLGALGGLSSHLTFNKGDA